MEKAFYYLQAPIERVTGFDIVIPLFSREKAYLPSTERILRAARKVLATS
jgi:pyruvate dehydrogenase E1 component beta subunit